MWRRILYLFPTSKLSYYQSPGARNTSSVLFLSWPVRLRGAMLVLLRHSQKSLGTRLGRRRAVYVARDIDSAKSRIPYFGLKQESGSRSVLVRTPLPTTITTYKCKGNWLKEVISWRSNLILSWLSTGTAKIGSSFSEPVLNSERKNTVSWSHTYMELNHWRLLVFNPELFSVFLSQLPTKVAYIIMMIISQVY